MKIAYQLRAFLDKNEYLSLPLIGKFDLENKNIESNCINFSPISDSESDPLLITFLCNRMNKDSNVIASDLHCFCYSLKELIIQGFEAEIPGIGFVYLGTNNVLKYAINSQYHSAHHSIKKKSSAIMSASFWM